ncbi:MAG: isocitrate dehydrogenase [Halobacteriovorax sp.]|nr:isocitrate dehydrogenase [Halobacteriovorax sp.]
MSNRITVAYGDGIGPEIMKACLRIMKEAGAQLEIDEIEIGEKLYLSGNTAGIREEDWKTIVDNKIFFKAPITTPQGGGYKSLNVTVRKTLGLFSNVRPVRSLSPYVETKHPEMNMVIVRENEEDLYAGIEHRQTQEVFQCLKLISRPGTEKIIRFAFEYAKNAGRKKVTCMSKDNIMKLTDGEFHRAFDEISKEYPEIEADHWIIDIGAAKIADTPEDFDVVVMANLYGDIVSDIAAQITGSVGLAGSANIGEECAMFEAIHGSAPMIAGQGVANPSGLLMGGVQMLNYMGQNDIAEKIENAWLTTLEEGVHTFDIYNEQTSTKKVTTEEFADEVIKRLGSKPTKLPAASYPKDAKKIEVKLSKTPMQEKKLDGVDVFLECQDRNPNNLGEKLISATNDSDLNLIMITNRGVKVFPNGNPLTFCTDHWRCRFMSDSGKELSNSDVIELLKLINDAGLDAIKTENLYTFDGKRGYSLGQGQ